MQQVKNYLIHYSDLIFKNALPIIFWEHGCTKQNTLLNVGKSGQMWANVGKNSRKFWSNKIMENQNINAITQGYKDLFKYILICSQWNKRINYISG